MKHKRNRLQEIGKWSQGAILSGIAVMLLGMAWAGPLAALPDDKKWQSVFAPSELGLSGFSGFGMVFDGKGNLYVGGWFSSAGGVANTNNIALWDGSSWSALGIGIDGYVVAVVLDDAGNLYAGGNFKNAGGTSANSIARWDGSNWSALGDGINGQVFNLVIDSAGTLYASGEFDDASGVANTSNIAMWNGSNWSALGSGMDDAVSGLVVDDADNLYAGGKFSSPEDGLAMWDGSSWSSVGNGPDGVHDLVIDSAGNLYVGGSFASANGVENTKNIAMWDGSSWSALGIGVNASVEPLALDGDGNLYAGGKFTMAGGVVANHIARWDGANWSALGSGTDNTVWGLAHDGVGNLFVGGEFDFAGGKASSRIGWWSDIPCALWNITVTADAMLRDITAEWLGRCVYGPTHTPPSYGGVYTDVADGDYSADWIQQLLVDTITEGCGDSTIYCPKDAVSKSQGAKLILKAAGETENPPSVPPYADVPITHTDAGWINRAKELGVTTGCGDGTNFCPDAVSTHQGFLNMLGGAF